MLIEDEQLIRLIFFINRPYESAYVPEEEHFLEWDGEEEEQLKESLSDP